MEEEFKIFEEIQNNNLQELVTGAIILIGGMVPAAMVSSFNLLDSKMPI